MVFVDSMSDLFNEEVPEVFFKRIFNTMNLASQHQYQVLTKRSEKLLEMNAVLKWENHIWAPDEPEGNGIFLPEFFNQFFDNAMVMGSMEEQCSSMRITSGLTGYCQSC